MNNFCIKEDQVLKASVAHLYPDFPSVLPPGHSDNPGLTLERPCLNVNGERGSTLDVFARPLMHRLLVFTRVKHALGLRCFVDVEFSRWRRRSRNFPGYMLYISIDSSFLRKLNPQLYKLILI